MSEVRKECLLLLARQLALRDGLVWARLLPKRRDQLLAHAGVMLASVERLAKVDWGGRGKGDR